MNIKAHKRSRFSVLIVVILLVFGFTAELLNTTTQVNAATWDGRAWRWSGDGSTYYSASYFENKYLYSMEGAYGYYPAVIPTSNMYRNGSNAIPASVDTVDELVEFLRSLNRTSGSSLNARWKRAGAAFVVHSLLGRSGNQANSNGGRTISNSDFENLRNRLNAARSISWNAVASTDGVNTQSANGSDVDVQAVRNTRSDVAIVITDSKGNQYKIFRKCANPVGSLVGLADTNFNLTPTITGSPSVIEQSTNITLNPAISNSGTGPASNTRWRITEFRVNPGGTVPGLGTGSAEPRTYYGNTFINEESGTTTFQVGVHTFNQRTRSTGDISSFPVGTRLCYALSAQPYSHTTGNNWRYGTPFCVVIAKSPKAQIWGSDLIVMNGQVVGSTSTRDVSGVSRLFGSWVEYGIIASGTVTGTASGAGYARGATNNAFCEVSVLTFTNAVNNTCSDAHAKGNYSGVVSNVSSIKARFSGGTPRTDSTLNLSSLSRGQYTFDRSSLTITTNGAGTITKGKYIILSAPNAVVTINNNIRYTDERLVNAGEIPQVVIIAREINIRGNVSQLDAWLIADTVNTCSDVALTAPLSSSICNQQLVVNGPVIADTIHLRRTHGADGGSPGTPAEIFNLRPDAYLWATHLTTSSGRLQSTATKELPPRF